MRNITQTGLVLNQAELEQIKTLLNVYETCKSNGIHDHELAELVYNEYDKEYQLLLYYKHDGEFVEGDTVAAVRGKLEVVLKCHWCDVNTNERFAVSKNTVYGTETEDVCQGCYES